MLSNILQLGLSAWEERVAATMYLHQTPFQPEAFESGSAQRLGQAVQRLRELPNAWARELALETIVREERKGATNSKP